MLGRQRQPRAARRWWQHLLRVGVLASVALAAIYVTFPLWAPTNMIRQKVRSDLSQMLGVDVSVGRLDISWSGGVQVSDVRIASGESFGKAPLLELGKYTGEYSPYNLLISRRLQWVVLEEPRLHVRLDEAGNCNLSVLSRLDDADGPKADRITIRNAVVEFHLPRQETPLTLEVSDMQVSGGKTTLGSVTMSAGLLQAARSAGPATTEPTCQANAPVSVKFTGGPEDSHEAASASLCFSQIDLQQLNLPRLLNLPLSHLRGRCSGSLNLQINRQAVVDGMSLDVNVSQLDVQPLDGPRMPIFDEAHLRVNATFDLAVAGGEGKIEIRSASVRLPGVDLAGHATLRADVRQGHWDAIEALEMKGEVHPERLTALMGLESAGRLPAVSGPLKFEVLAGRDREDLELTVTADATACSISRGGREVKPAGRPMKLAMESDLDLTKGDYLFEDTSLSLGGNRMTIGGRIYRLDRLSQRLLEGQGRADLTQALASLDLQGNVEFCEMESLCDFAPEARALLESVQAQGALEGQWSFRGQDGLRLRAGLRSPAGKRFAVPGVINKPQAAAMSIEAAGVVADDLRSLRDVDVDIRVDQPSGDKRSPAGRLSVNRAQISLEGAGAERKLSFSGQYDADCSEALVACITSPMLKDISLDGRIYGQFDGALSADVQQATVQADMDSLKAGVGSFFQKGADEQARARAKLVRRDGKCQLTLDATLAGARATIAGRLGADGRCEDIDATIDVRDAAWVAKSSPWLQRRLENQELHGPMAIHLQGASQDHVLQAKVRLEADKLEYISKDKVRRAKRAGTELRADATASVVCGAALFLPESGKLESLNVQLGKSRLSVSASSSQMQPAIVGVMRDVISGKAGLTEVVSIPRTLPASVPEEFQLEVKGVLSADEAMADLVPEVSDWIRGGKVRGEIAIGGGLSRLGDRIAAGVTVDAAELAADDVPLPIGDLLLEGDAPRAFTLLKAKGSPCKGELELDLTKNLSRLRLRNIRAQVGSLNAVIDAEAEIEPGGWRLPENVIARKTHVSAWTGDASAVAGMFPALAPLAISGDFFIDAEWRYPQGERPEFATVDLLINKLGGRYRYKDVSIGGELKISGISADAQGYHVAAVRTDGLSVRAGDNNVTVIADFKDLPEKPAGRFDVMSSFLDDQDLSRWLGPPETPSSAPATEATSSAASTAASGAASRPGLAKTPPPEKLVLEARYLAAMMREHLESADITGAVSIEHLRTFDATVGQTYEPKCVDLKVAIKDGHLKADYATCVNGGDYRKQVEVQVTDPKASAHVISQVSDMMAAPNIQPQLARYFPGNTVFGTFSQTQDIRMDFEEVVLSLLDPRYPPRLVGTGVTVTTDGELVGRAAPQVVTRLFPGLNLAKYRYNKMTAFAEFKPDGTAINDMIFSGRQYDTYIEGTTGPDNIGKYDMGLILLGTPQTPELNHRYKLGRLLLFSVKARIEDGQLYDQQVSYPWPNEVIGALIITNNPVYRLWATRPK